MSIRAHLSVFIIKKMGRGYQQTTNRDYDRFAPARNKQMAQNNNDKAEDEQNKW